MIRRILLPLLVICAAPALAEPMTFRLAGNGGNCSECAWIAAEGEITEAAPGALTSFLDDHHARLVVFDSPGGDLGAALRMGRILRDRGKATGVGRTVRDAYGTFSTVVEGTCESACAFAFMGGEARRIDQPDANQFVPLPGKVGMHRFYTRTGNEIPSAATQQIMGQLLIYVQDMGVDPRVLSLASTASEDEMYFFSVDEREELRLVTARSQADPVPLIVGDGLALEWTVYDDTGEAGRHIRISCKDAPDTWILQVTSLNSARPGDQRHATWTETAFAPLASDARLYDADTMFNDLHIRIAGERLEMARSAVLAEEGNGRDLRLTVRLPVDLRDHAAQEYRFVTTKLRMATGVYWASGAMAGADTLNVLARACPTS